MNNRIESLRKEDYLKRRFHEKGLDEFLADLKVTVHEGDAWYELWKKYVRAVIRKFRSIELSPELLKLISSGPWRVRYQPMDDFDGYPKLVEVLDSVLKLRNAAARDKTIVKVMYEVGSNSNEGFSVLGQEIPEKYHAGRWGWKPHHYRLYDIRRLLATCYANNAFIQYVKENKVHLQHKLALDLSERSQMEQVRFRVNNPEVNQDMFRLAQEHGYMFCDAEDAEEIEVSIPHDLYYLTEDDYGDFKVNSDEKARLLQQVMVPMFMRDMAYLQDDAERIADSVHDYSRAWQTKKNISQKVQQRMKDNEFLYCYGVVELDNEVDLKKFSELEQELREFRKKTYVPISKDHSFRIRKLGNYRALGVYFPLYQATIIDLDGPDAFAHELFHQTDYSTRDDGKLLSEQADFFPVYSAYAKAVRKRINELPDSDPFVAQWFGKTKYNADYYLRNTEVFARSGELYLHEILGIRSSFLQTNYDSPVYPKDEAFLSVVRRYFDRILPKPLNVDEEIEAHSRVAASIEQVECIQFTDFGGAIEQLWFQF
ncbi:hypothetical protein SAMN04487897_13113 [Paenibacillus sp. yr247]|uniref:hypothetical protein n=1 Tax=Paenibacillus sp. yr247 TaxID=1761880 RepID=UPI0008899516|nr:hypothetical protein [Paenibacillus sp. yr247]SDP01961.1 hypothetical protein SAMN04487897_13113 [Paenibacillus sp. yr247]